jgi:Holliday junction resolvasome RuvABC endonuclease subunit
MMTTPVTLALDLATQLGFALLRADGRIESGSEGFQVGAKERPGVRWVRFRTWLLEMKRCQDFTDVAYEQVIGQMPGQVRASQVYGGFEATLQSFCEHHAISYRGLGVSKVKQAWTGKGNADKALMIARCRELGFNPVDDNEADAIALLHVHLGRVPRLTLEQQAAKLRRKPKPNPDTKTRPLGVDPPPF